MKDLSKKGLVAPRVKAEPITVEEEEDSHCVQLTSTRA